jgi:hypothetical protein
MKKILVVISLVVVVALVVFALFSKKTNSIIVTNRYSIPTSFNSAVPFGDNTVIYSNGGSLEAYNYSNATSTFIGPNSAGLGIIDTVSVTSDNNFVVFHDQLVNGGGLLANKLTTAGLNTQFGYWWVYSLSANTYSLLPQTVVLAKAVGNNIYALTPGNGSEQLTTYSPSNLTQTASISVPGNINFYPYNGGFLLQTTSNNILYTNGGTVSQQVLSNANMVGVINNIAIATQSTKSSKQLVSINLQNYKATTVAGNVQGQPAWLGTGQALYVSSSSVNSPENIYEYNTTNNEVSLWKLEPNISDFGASGPAVSSFIGPSAAIISSNTSSYYLVGNNIANTTILY